LYSIPTTFGTNVFLDFVANANAGTTELFVNGVDTGSSVAFAVSISGPVTVGGSEASTNSFIDEFNGSIIAAATYNSGLSASEILAHYDAFIKPAPPTLNITQSDNVVVVSWNVTGSYTLLQTTNLASGVWTTNTSFTSLNGTAILTISPPLEMCFFRLRIP